jgi:Fe(3+) dicitrate transport protein
VPLDGGVAPVVPVETTTVLPPTLTLPAREPNTAGDEVVVPAPSTSAPAPQREASTTAGEQTLEVPAIDVTVVGTRLANTAGSAHVISNRQLERFEYDDPTAVLLSTPGLYVRTEDGMGLRPNIGLRGVDPDRSKKVTLLEDGVLLGPAPYSAPAAYFFPLITRMTKVSVIKGPAAISYGPQTVAGAIDLQTRAIPLETSAAADVAVGQYGYGKAHVWAGTSTDQFGFLVEGVRLQNNGFKELPNGADTGVVRNEWMVKSSYIIDPDADVKNELRLKLSYSDEVSNESYLGLTDADFRADPNQRYAASQLDRMSNHRAALVLTHVLTPSPSWSLTTNVYRHNYARTWRKVNEIRNPNDSRRPLFNTLTSPNARESGALATLRGEPGATDQVLIGPNERNFVSQGIESRLRWNGKTGALSQRVEAGFRYHYDSIERRHTQNAYTVDGGRLLPVERATEITALNHELTHAVSLHVADALSYRGLTLTPGMRVELYRMVSDDSLSAEQLIEGKQKDFGYGLLPGVGAYYALYRGLGVLAGVYRGFSPPPPGSSEGTKPEDSTNYEAGARFTAGALRLESIFFYNDYRNITSYCSESNCGDRMQLDKQSDAGTARIFGVEALAEHDIPAGAVKLPVSVAYTFTRAEFLQTLARRQTGLPYDIEKGDEIPYVPTHQLRAQLGVEHPRGGLFVAATYVSAMLEEAGDLGAQSEKSVAPAAKRLTTDEQFIVDISAFAKLWGPLSLYANVQNLFDKQYIVSRRPFGARPNAPRWTHVGIKAAF